MSAVERAAAVIQRALVVNDGNENLPVWEVYKSEGVALVIRQALADAGLLLSDADRAVLDAADRFERIPHFLSVASIESENRLRAAVRARREAQP